MKAADGTIPTSARKPASSIGSASRRARWTGESGAQPAAKSGIATFPSASQSRARRRARALVASGTGPPHIPLCTG
jgi:hypothetical protein